jgi:hypothetical protein
MARMRLVTASTMLLCAAAFAQEPPEGVRQDANPSTEHRLPEATSQPRTPKDVPSELKLKDFRFGQTAVYDPATQSLALFSAKTNREVLRLQRKDGSEVYLDAKTHERLDPATIQALAQNRPPAKPSAPPVASNNSSRTFIFVGKKGADEVVQPQVSVIGTRGEQYVFNAHSQQLIEVRFPGSCETGLWASDSGAALRWKEAGDLEFTASSPDGLPCALRRRVCGTLVVLECNPGAVCPSPEACWMLKNGEPIVLNNMTWLLAGRTAEDPDCDIYTCGCAVVQDNRPSR